MAIAVVFCMAAGVATAQDSAAQTDQQAANKAAPQRNSVSSTSNTTTSNDTKRVQELNTVTVQAQSLSLGGGLMSVQTAPKAVSTITRDAIVQAAPGSNFTQMIESIPGVNSSTDDVTGLSDGNYSIRGFSSNEIGVTVNGAPIYDSGSYATYATEYGDTENYGDITVLQGIPDVDMPDSGAAGGHIAWATIDPSHTAGVDVTQSVGSNDYRRTFVRLNTGDLGPVRSWLSYSDNSVDKWRGAGDLNVTKVEGKSLWTINDDNSVTASFQYNREVRNSYLGPTKAQANKDYDYDYDVSYKPGSLDTNYYALHTNPFSNYLVSLDGEFKLADSLRLSVVPYFQYGDGGSGSGNSYFAETTNGTQNQYEYAHQDLNQDGAIVTGPNGKKSLVYMFSHTTTYRPGVIFKFNQDLGTDDSLEYGAWYEKTRQEQSQTAGLASFETGQPNDLWGDSNYVLYPDGQPQKSYNEFTRTETQKVFATNTWTPNDQWLVSVGAAYLHVERKGFAYEYPDSNGGYEKGFGSDNLSATFHSVTPSLGVKYSPDEKNQFYYGVGKSYRAPPNSAIFLNDVTGREPNKAESAWNNDLGWRYYGDRASASASIYRSNFHNKTLSGYDQNTGESFYTQLDRVKMQGFNAEGSFNFTEQWKVYGSYTYTQAKVESNFDSGDDGIFATKGKTLFNTPRNLANLRLSYNNGPFWANVSAKYRSSIYGDYMNTERAGGYTTFNFNAGYHFGDLGNWLTKPYIKLNVANIMDHRAFTNANNASAYLASNPGNLIKGLDGTKLYTSAPYYSLLQPRTFMVTVGASFF
ncbi:TonB-dependent receptor [Dyella sedimenti]|uniref:TonB-dependent receptor n=1 Tax=Dyella sedimenti TaxID=2919947 RepID=UPI001FAA206B|nr:TonB-dependent receptor [Dyella sedimenti]